MCLVFSPLKCTHFWMANKYKIKLRISLPVRMDDYDGEAFWNPMLTPRFNSFGAYVWSSYQVLGYNRCKHNLVSRVSSLLNFPFISSKHLFIQFSQLFSVCAEGIGRDPLTYFTGMTTGDRQSCLTAPRQLNDIIAFYGSSQCSEQCRWNKCVIQLHQYVLIKLHFY